MNNNFLKVFNYSVLLLMHLLSMIIIILILTSCAPTSKNNVIIVEHATRPFDSGKNIYSAYIKNNKLRIKKFLIDDISKSHCSKNMSTFRQVVVMNPIIVECLSYESKTKNKILITNGDWVYFYATSGERVLGNSEEFLVLDDFTLINKNTGQIIKDNVVDGDRKAPYNKVIQAYALTVSQNNRFFTFDYNERTVSEISSTGIKSKIVKLPITFIGVTIVEDMIASNAGDYLFLHIEHSRRGSSSNYFYIIDVKNKEIIYKLALNKSGTVENVFLQNQDDNILLIFRLKETKTTHAYWMRIKSNLQTGDK